MPEKSGMPKLFILFCSAQDGESTDINCLVFWAHCEMSKFPQNAKSIIRGFSQFWVIFHNNYEILISLECAVDCE